MSLFDVSNGGAIMHVLRNWGLLASFALFTVALCMLPMQRAHSAGCATVDNITVGAWSTNLGDISLYYAQENGQLADQCLSITVKGIAGGVAGRSLALITGEIDLLSGISSLPAIRNRADKLAGIAPEVRALIVVAPTLRQMYALVGRTSLSGVVGQRIAIARCAWSGDVTSPREDAPESAPSHPTQVIAAHLRSALPGVRIYCGMQADDPERAAKGLSTVYLEPRGFSTKRVTALRNGEVNFAMLTTPQQYSLASEGFHVYVQPEEFASFPEGGILALASRRADSGFADRVARLRTALMKANEAMVADPTATAQWLTTFAVKQDRGSIRGIENAAHAALATSFMVDHLLSTTGCVSHAAMERYAQYMGYQASVAGDFYDPAIRCQ